VGAYQAYSALLQAALKLLPLGPGATQVILQEALSAVEAEFAGVLACGDDELGTFNPLWDIAAARHERAGARMFIS
jgi:urease accessory protein